MKTVIRAERHVLRNPRHRTPETTLAQIGGYVRLHHRHQSHEVIALSTAGQVGMVAPGQLQLAVELACALAASRTRRMGSARPETHRRG